MLNTMRNHAGGWMAKLLLGLLILSFTVWGVEDMLKTGAGNATVATVGDQEISTVAFERAYRSEMERARITLGKNYSPELAKLLRLERKAVQDLVASEIIRQETLALGIVPADADVAREIRRNERFKNEDGKFDKNLYLYSLRQTGITEKAYVEDVKRALSTRLLLDALNAGTPMNRVMAAYVYQAAGEERSADIVTLTPGMIKDLGEPDEKALQAYYDKRKDDFAEPETRVVSTLVVTSAQLMQDIKISTEEVKAIYDERAKMFGAENAEPFEKAKPAIEQELKQQKGEEAVPNFSAKLEDALAGGTSLKDTAKEFGLELHTLPEMNARGVRPNGEKAAIPAYPNFLETAFRLDEGSESALTPARDKSGTYYLVHVDKVTPEQTPPLEKIRAQLVDAWKKQEAATRLRALADTVQAELREAKNPAEVLSKHGLRTTQSGRISRMSQNSSTNLALPGALTQELFTLKPGTATGAYPAEGGSVMIGILRETHPAAKVTPDALKKNAEAKMLATELESSAKNELVGTYLDFLQTKYHVQINDEALAAVAGAQQ